MKSITLGAVATAALMTMATAAEAQNTGSARGIRLMDMLRNETVARTAGGAENLMSAEIGALSTGQNRETHLVGGWGGDVRIVAFCDQYCSDLDLFVVDDLGQEVVSDVNTDATPAVNFRALAGRTYRLRVRMYACDADMVCMYGQAAFWR